VLTAAGEGAPEKQGRPSFFATGPEVVFRVVSLGLFVVLEECCACCPKAREVDGASPSSAAQPRGREVEKSRPFLEHERPSTQRVKGLRVKVLETEIEQGVAAQDDGGEAK